MKILITGAHGQLGVDCVRELKQRGYRNLYALDKEEFDVTNEGEMRLRMKELCPDVVIHCAAWTAVDLAEQHEKEVWQINAEGAKCLATLCKEGGAKLVFLSTDYVFDGRKEGFYDVSDEKNPLSVYAKSKAAGEDFVREILKESFIVRTSWMYGQGGPNFVKTMLRLAASGKKAIDVVDDQIGSPTYAVDLAKLLADMIETDRYGVYHATGEGFCSWAEFAERIFALSGWDVTVHPVTTAAYAAKVRGQAKRPLNSKLDKSSLEKNGFCRLPHWQDGLARFLQQEIK
ncbi:MAG: dTDP-4-dehydrorhamnose reductase [Clostridia bacterium]|nr:dTDP-4-dehydrorhamnose reductase [Clostridia bacterium]